MKQINIEPVVGNIQPPASLTELKQTFTDFDNLLGDVDNILSPTYKILNDILPLLEMPADINTAMNELEEVVIGIEAATAVLIAIPIVGEVVAGVDEVIDDIIEIAKDAQETIIVPINDFCQPIKESIQKIEKPIQDIDNAVVELQGLITKWGVSLDVIQEALALAAGIGNAFDKAGQESVGLVFAKLVDAYNTVVNEINKPLAVINKAMEDIDKVIKPLGDAMSKLQTGTFDKISDSVQNVNNVLTTLNPLHELLSHVQCVLKPFEWVLDKAGKIINKILGPVLDPLMKPLENKILSVIGLPKDFTTQLTAAISDTSSSDSTKNGSDQIASNQILVQNNQNNLESTMSDFVSGDINDICSNLLKIIQQNANTPNNG